MVTDIMSHHEIPQIPGEIPERMEPVPEAFSPHLRRDPMVDPGDEGRSDEQPDKHSFFPRRGPLKPGRNDRNDQVQSDQRVHEPKMSRHRREIERQHLQVSCRLTPVHPAEKGREDDIKQQERDRRRKNSREAPAVETAHGLAGLQRHEEERRHNHE